MKKSIVRKRMPHALNKEAMVKEEITGSNQSPFKVESKLPHKGIQIRVCTFTGASSTISEDSHASQTKRTQAQALEEKVAKRTKKGLSAFKKWKNLH